MDKHNHDYIEQKIKRDAMILAALACPSMKLIDTTGIIASNQCTKSCTIKDTCTETKINKILIATETKHGNTRMCILSNIGNKHDKNIWKATS